MDVKIHYVYFMQKLCVLNTQTIAQGLGLTVRTVKYGHFGPFTDIGPRRADAQGSRV